MMFNFENQDGEFAIIIDVSYQDIVNDEINEQIINSFEFQRQVIKPSKTRLDKLKTMLWNGRIKVKPLLQSVVTMLPRLFWVLLF